MIYKKEFYFIRHGQTDYNAAFIEAGYTEYHASLIKAGYDDLPLNTTGVKQAHSIEPVIANLTIKSVCCSPLKRAKETKEIITSRMQTLHYEIPELSECTQEVWDDMTSYGPNAFAHSPLHVKSFMEQALNGVNKALSCEGPILIVAHGGIHWAICCLMNITHHDWIIDNCHPVHFFVDNQGLWTVKSLA